MDKRTVNNENYPHFKPSMHGGPATFPFELVVLFTVAIPLLLIRRFESPRRRVSVWFFDLGRLVVGYASAEVLLMILLIPYTSRVHRYFNSSNAGFPSNIGSSGDAERNKLDPNGSNTVPPHLDKSQPEAYGSTADGSPTGEIVKRFVDAMVAAVAEKVAINEEASSTEQTDSKATGSPINRKWVPFRIETTSLTLSLLEIFPGLFFIYGIYMILLYAAYRIKLFYLQRSNRIKYVHDPDQDSWTVYSSNSNNLESRITNPFHNYEDDLNRRNRQTHLSKTDLGFTSGNYGHPVRLAWAVQQTAIFAISVFLVRLSLFFICVRFPKATDVLRNFLFSWTNKLPTKGGRWFMSMFFLPSLIYIAQFTISDYILKYHTSKKKRNFFFNLPSYSYGDDTPFGSAQSGTFELQELSIPGIDNRMRRFTANSDENSLNPLRSGVSRPSSIQASLVDDTNHYSNYAEPFSYSTQRGGEDTTATNHPLEVYVNDPYHNDTHSAPIVNSFTHNTNTVHSSAPIQGDDGDDDLWVPAGPRPRVNIPASPPLRYSVAMATSSSSTPISIPRPSYERETNSGSLHTYSSHNRAPASNLEEEIEETFKDIKELGKSAWEKVSKSVVDSTTARYSIHNFSNSAVSGGIRFGLVTATMLNAVAANATASARPFLFNTINSNGGLNRGGILGGASITAANHNTSDIELALEANGIDQPNNDQSDSSVPYNYSTPDSRSFYNNSSTTQTSPETYMSVSDRYNLNNIDSEEDLENSGSPFEHDDVANSLPSYDDSQRQHQELLRDRTKAERQHQRIRDLKRV